MVAQRICRLIITCLVSFKRCHLLFFYFLLHKRLSYVEQYLNESLKTEPGFKEELDKMKTINN